MLQVQRCFTSTETVLRTIRDGEPGTAASTFTQLLSSELRARFSVALRPQRPQGLFSIALRPQKPQGLLGMATSTFTQLQSSDVVMDHGTELFFYFTNWDTVE